MKIEIIGLDGALARLAALRDRKFALKAADAMAISYIRDLRQYLGANVAHFAYSSGKLAKSLKIKFPADGALIETKARHARAVEYGTRAHAIAPRFRRGKKALRFRAGEGYLIRRRVMHPGTRPKPFFFADFPARIARATQAAAAAVGETLRD